ILQARACRKRFQEELEKRQFKRVIKRQNEKLLDLGKKLKLKGEKAREQINAAQERLAQMPPQTPPEEFSIQDISLSSLMEDLGLPVTPKNILQLFAAAQHSLEGQMTLLAQEEKISWDAPELQELNINFEDLLAPDAAEDNAMPPPVVNTLRAMVYFNLLTSKEAREFFPGESGINIANTSKGGLITTFLEVNTDEDQLQASLRTKKLLNSNEITAADILEFAQEIGITHGLVSQENLQKWMDKTPAPKSEFILAKGTPSQPNSDGQIEYFFKINYTNPGKILEDGSIDFRDRGDIPFVKAETILARKTSPKQGEPGINVYGESIPLPELYDPPLLAGNGTQASEDEMEIIATQDGQPHLDALGSVSVNKDMLIQGDVDFKTGNVNFNGNIIVMGRVKEGFSVKGISLTTKAVEGAVIELSGDLNVSNGMTNTVVKNVANVHAKFINNCKIKGFGNILVQKEVVDSNVLVSGKCDISKGHIIASTISASQGIEGRIIGTEASAPPLLKVGITDHIDSLLKENKTAIQASMEKI
ncbi:MAG: FapA family protein, partial [Desulfovibrionales bacterium]|nr:FapA family protein [Desulfovibrionales bacterium]